MRSSRKVLEAADRLASMFITAYENEQQGYLPANGKLHSCKSCYEAAKELRESITKVLRP